VLDEFFEIKVELTERELAELDDIRLRIEGGRPLRRYYRRTKGYDTLLKERGIMHLHLSHAGSDKLVYLMQFPGHVLLLRVDTHLHLEDRPVGKRFLMTGIQRFQRRLRQAGLAPPWPHLAPHRRSAASAAAHSLNPANFRVGFPGTARRVRRRSAHSLFEADSGLMREQAADDAGADTRI
jgi:hypothetical protein